MKKRNRIFASALLILMLLVPGIAGKQVYAAQDIHVYDDAGILTKSEWTELETRAEELTEQYHCGVYIVTEMQYFLNSERAEERGKEFYRENNLGYGEGKDGFLLYMAMQSRDYALLAYGDYGNEALTDYGKEYMSIWFLSEFKKDQWAKGFEAYLDRCEKYLEMASEGTPYDSDTIEMEPGKRAGLAYGFALIVGLISALITCSIFKGKMKNVQEASGARDYIENQGTKIRLRNDRYINTTTSRRKIKTESSGSSHGTSVGRDGFSGRSGKF